MHSSEIGKTLRKLFTLLVLVGALLVASSDLGVKKARAAMCCNTCYDQCQQQYDGCFQNCIDMMPDMGDGAVYNCTSQCNRQYSSCQMHCSSTCDSGC